MYLLNCKKHKNQTRHHKCFVFVYQLPHSCVGWRNFVFLEKKQHLVNNMSLVHTIVNITVVVMLVCFQWWFTTKQKVNVLKNPQNTYAFAHRRKHRFQIVLIHRFFFQKLEQNQWSRSHHGNSPRAKQMRPQ